MNQLAEYQEVRQALRLTLRLLELGPSWYIITLTARRPNPAYERIHWRDTKSTVPSHVETLKVVSSWDTLAAGRLEYRRLIALLRFMGSEIPELAPIAPPAQTDAQLAELRAEIKAEKKRLKAEKPKSRTDGFIPYRKG